MSGIPINPFEIVMKKGYVLIPFLKMSKETLKLLRKTASSGASIRNEEGTYKIFYDDSDSPCRQRFTVMHEIGHILLGHKQDSEYAEKCKICIRHTMNSIRTTVLVGLIKNSKKKINLKC